MGFTSVSVNKGNRLKARIPERFIVCSVRETLAFTTTVKSQLLLPVCGLPPPAPDNPGFGDPRLPGDTAREVACVEVDRVVDRCRASRSRSLEWWYAPPEPPSPFPPLFVTGCTAVPGTTSCVLRPVPGKAGLVLVQAWYDFALLVTYIDEEGNPARVTIPSAQLTWGVVLIGIPGGGCSVTLEVECKSCEVRSGEDALSTYCRPLVSPSACALYRSGLRDRGA